jgi:signal transduction histidine kinase
MAKSGLPPKKSETEELAAMCARARGLLMDAGSSLHNHIGPLLAAAGLRLQLLRMDVPDAATQVNEVLQILDQAVERVRSLSQELSPSPALRGGLKNALLRLAEQHSEPGGRHAAVNYSATALLPIEAAAALHEAASAAVAEAARHGASRIDISAKGAKDVRIRITDDGRTQGRARALSIAQRLARESGLELEISTGKSTIVSIRYAVRRAPRG